LACYIFYILKEGMLLEETRRDTLGGAVNLLNKPRRPDTLSGCSRFRKAGTWPKATL
jgi:hypothetical protein